MKKSGRKLLGILLAASMAVTTMFPVHGLAAEGNGNGYEGTEEALAEGVAAESPEEGQQPVDGNAGSEAAGGEQMSADDGVNPEMQAGEQQPVDGGTNPEIQSGEQQPEETKPEMLDGNQQLEEANPEASEGKQEPAEEGQQPADEGGKQEILEEGQKPADEGKESNSPDKKPESAEEGAEPEAVEEGQKPEGGSEPEASGKEQESGNEGQGIEEKAPEDGQADGEEPKEEEGQLAGGEQGTEEAKMGTFMLPQRDGEEDIMPLEDIYDINQPVIESFEFKENGQKLTTADTLHFSMSVYDNDSEIKVVSVGIRGDDYRTVNLEEGNVKNLYEGTLSCSKLYGNNYYVGKIYVEDMRGNCINADVYGDNDQLLYTFTLDNEIPEKDENVSVSNFQMQASFSNADEKLRVGDTVTYTADISYKDEEIDSVSMELYSPANGASKLESITMDYNADTKKLSGRYTVTSETYPSEWELYKISVYTKSGKNYRFYPSSLENLKFDVVQENYDTEKPVIESITIDQNGKEVKAGDVVTMKVKVKEEHPSSAYAYFYPQVSNVSVSSYVNLEYNADTSEYVGTIEITKDTYPCEWALTDLTIYDEIGHRTSLYDFQPDWYDTYPWYYKVKSGNTYREDCKNVTFQFYGLAKQEDGSYQQNSLISEEIKEVGRRASLKDLKVSFPEPIEGVKTEWKYKRWGEWEEGVLVDEEKEILFSGTSDMDYPMYATYDKGCANVYLTYMSKEDGMKSICQPVFVDRETTYKEVLDSFKLPADAIEDGCLGIEPSKDYYYNESEQVWDVSNIHVEAKYNYCQVAWTTRYIGSDGKEATNTFNESYIEGTTISDALAALEKPATPSNLEFEAWALSTPEGPEAITQPMANLEATAVYRGKTTVDASYSYRGEEGKMVSGSELMTLDGEGLSNAAILGEATIIFKTANHLKDLLLSEWTNTVTIDQPRYKNIQFQAKYYNCVVTLNLPDKTSQYIVVDKGASYTLPTEVGSYTDIVWAGHEKGAAVTINEDTEFTAQEYKESAQEGIKLSDEEVADVVEKIKNAPEGATIPIDMKKATVIPKEVQEAIQGKSVSIVLQMDSYSWTLNGMDVAATNLKDIDLEVKIDTNAIPSNIVASIAGDSPTTQLSLTHNGDFGFRANLSLNLGSEHAGSTGNLYYYDSDGKLIFINAGQIGADGSTSLPFSHASDYVIVIDKKSSNTDSADKDEDSKDTDSADKDEDSKNTDPADKDGDSENKDPADNDGDSQKEEDENPEWDGENLPGKEDEDSGEYEEKDSSNGRTDELATIKRKPTNPVTDSNSPNTAKTDSTGSVNSTQFKSPKTGE